jgi:hypothetical protein
MSDAPIKHEGPDSWSCAQCLSLRADQPRRLPWRPPASTVAEALASSVEVLMRAIKAPPLLIRYHPSEPAPEPLSPPYADRLRSLARKIAYQRSRQPEPTEPQPEQVRLWGDR